MVAGTVMTTSAEYHGGTTHDNGHDLRGFLEDPIGVHVDPTDTRPQSQVLVIYTGGTIGMRCTNDGVYEPEKDYLPNVIRTIPMLNDQQYLDKISLEPGLMNKRKYGHRYALPPLKNESKRVVYEILQYDPLLDSCDMTFDDWIHIATDIMNNYEKFDGFVVLHGTDTLCYTASAVSFMLENLGKPIVFTGSQIPIAEVRSDGHENFIGALIIAGNYDIPEVTIYFNNKLIRGNRCSKLDNSGLDAFNSPNMVPLATMEINISVDWRSVFRSQVPERVSLHTQLVRNVGLLRIFPSISLEHVKTFLMEPIQGVVLQTYGSGNIPSRRTDILEELRKAAQRGVIIVNCSQCARGKVSLAYATGKVLADAGVTSGADMTPEAALAKLAFVLGKSEWSVEKKRQMMGKNLRGELTVADAEKYGMSALQDMDFVRQFAEFMRVSSSQEMHMVRDALYPPLICSAAGTGDIQLLEKLEAAGANLGALDYDNRGAMHVACSNGLVDVVNFLLKKGVSVHARDRWNDTPLLNAIRSRHYDCIQAVTRAGAHLSLSSLAVGVELCINVNPSLASRDDVATLKAWNLAGVDLNCSDYDCRTPLHVAAAKGNFASLKFLLENGADFRLRDNFGNTALDEASRGRNCKADVVEVLRAFEEK